MPGKNDAPVPSRPQAQAILDLIHHRPGCHLIPERTAKSCMRNKWLTAQETVEETPLTGGRVLRSVAERRFTVTPAGYAAVGMQPPTEKRTCEGLGAEKAADARLTMITAEYTCEQGHTTVVEFMEDATTERGMVTTDEQCGECD
ncbi:hypothetical protein ACIQC7_35075 [Kitasatospora sp. NPDC088556]|uniref:hypothetical protein n=1 Tax=Kitasatospora sp. NPDC088556 TaxID=3364076 RepID=UPI003804C44E